MESTESVFTLDWENGYTMVEGARVASRSAAYARMDAMLRNAEYPDSLHIILRENGVAFWEQDGNTVTYNGAESTESIAARIVAVHTEDKTDIRDFLDSRPTDYDDLCKALGITLDQAIAARDYLETLRANDTNGN